MESPEEFARNRYWQNHTLQILRLSTPKTANQINGLRIVQGGLDTERGELASFRTKFHDSDKRAAILEERFKGKISIEIIHVACITVGAAALGYAPSIWQTQPTAWMTAIFGVVLIVAGLAAKAVKP